MFKQIEQWILDNPVKLKVILGVGVFLFLANLSTLERATTPVIIRDSIIKVDLAASKGVEPHKTLKAGIMPMMVKTPPKVAKKAPKRVIDTAPPGWYPAGQCTWLVWSKRPVPSWGDASEWKWQAKKAGWTVSNKPVRGAVGWTYGHVVWVQSVHGKTVTIVEANYDMNGSIRTRTVPTSKYTYLY